jgi:hypothetical protein
VAFSGKENPRKGRKEKEDNLKLEGKVKMQYGEKIL